AHARRFLEVVFRHTERLGRLLNDLTDLSNIELGRVSLQRGRVALAEVVEGALDIIRAKSDAGGVTLESRLPADLPPVEADRDGPAQIHIYLRDIAVKWTRRGARGAGDGVACDGLVEVPVVDAGVGI